MLDLNDAEIQALAGSPRLGIFFRLAVEPVQRLWLGVGDCEIGANALDEEDEIYKGLGQLTNVPAVQQLINGVAERVVFHVSGEGVSSDLMALAASESDDVKGAAVSLGIALFDAQWQQLGLPKWLFAGRADFLTVNMQSSDSGIERSIELSVGSLMTGRRRRGLSYLTDYDQQQRYPGDKFCERTALYENGVEKVWPRFT